MDKLRLSLLGGHEDFTRLYQDWPGFHNMEMPISLPGKEVLMLFLVSSTNYEMTIEGDALLKKAEDERLMSLGFHHFDVRWTEEAKAKNTGTAVVKLIHPDLIDEPLLLKLSLGEFSCGATKPVKEKAKQERSPLANRLFAERMMMSEMGYDRFGTLR